MTAQTLFEKIWQRHVIAQEAGEFLLYVDRALIHEGSSHAFAKLKAQRRRRYRQS
jgi:3-isopropylmalate/(R)-2-methylmalate dehydratase large subunit